MRMTDHGDGTLMSLSLNWQDWCVWGWGERGDGEGGWGERGREGDGERGGMRRDGESGNGEGEKWRGINTCTCANEWKHYRVTTCTSTHTMRYAYIPWPQSFSPMSNHIKVPPEPVLGAIPPSKICMLSRPCLWTLKQKRLQHQAHSGVHVYEGSWLCTV